MYNIVTSIEHAEKFFTWIRDRGGIAVWRSIDLSDPGAECFTPALTENNERYPKPHWKYANIPTAIINNPESITLESYQEVKRFRVGVRFSNNGLPLNLTDAASSRVRREEEKAGDKAYHIFDYETQEAVIMKPDPSKSITLAEWMAKRGVSLCETKR